jgi:hypothetical protein
MKNKLKYLIITAIVAISMMITTVVALAGPSTRG